jgi:hypothetical protein
LKPFKCADCGSICIEIKACGYPKEICEPNQTKVFHEYRFVCLKCGHEWLYDTLLKLIFSIPKDAQFHFDRNGKEVKASHVEIDKRAN